MISDFLGRKANPCFENLQPSKTMVQSSFLAFSLSNGVFPEETLATKI